MHYAPAGTPVTTTTVAALSDHHLLQRIKELTAVEHHIESVVSDHLREIERRRLYLTLGCSSMFDYAVRELGYSSGAAWRRLKAMRLCTEVAGARTRMQEGTLTLDAAAQLQRAFERQDRKQTIRSTTPDTAKPAGSVHGSEAGDRSPGARSAAASGGSAPNAQAHAAAAAATRVLDAAERESLVAQAVGKSTRQVQEMLAEVDPDLAAQTDRMRPLGCGRWELKAVIDDDCHLGLEQLKGLLSHVDPQMTTGQLLGRLVQEALDRHDPSRPPRGRRAGRRSTEVAAATSAPKDPAAHVTVPRTAQPAGAVSSRDATISRRPAAASSRPAEVAGATSAPKEASGPDTAAAAGTATSAPKVGGGPRQQAAPAARRTVRRATGAAPPQPRVRSRAIPAAVRRQVWERDRGCCSYVDEGSGRRCGSRHLLEIDHVVPYALGGNSEPDNLRLLCAAHHRHRHARREDASRRVAVCR